MTGAPAETLDTLIEAWELQQNAYVRHRAERFRIIMDALDYARPNVTSVLDLGAGLGSFSKLLLQRFPDVGVIAVDYDPALLTLARHNLAEYAHRVTFIEADLRDPAWTAGIGAVKPDAVVSSTALHWLPTHTLVGLYSNLTSVLNPQGLFFNADHLSYSTGPFFQNVSTLDDKAAQQAAFDSGVPDWDAWWKQLRETDGFAQLVAERDRRFAEDAPENLDLTPTMHTEALRVAGFSEVGTVWQYFDDYVVYGVR